MSQCKSGSVKDALKASLGKTDVSDIDVERFVEDSGRDAAAKAMKAAMQGSVSVPGYGLLRNPKYCPADVYTAKACHLYTSPSPRDQRGSRMPSSA